MVNNYMYITVTIYGMFGKLLWIDSLVQIQCAVVNVDFVSSTSVRLMSRSSSSLFRSEELSTCINRPDISLCGCMSLSDAWCIASILCIPIMPQSPPEASLEECMCLDLDCLTAHVRSWHGQRVPVSTPLSSFLYLTRRFWNQIFTCFSDRLRYVAISILRRRDRYILEENSRSRASSCELVNAVRILLLLFWSSESASVGDVSWDAGAAVKIQVSTNLV